MTKNDVGVKLSDKFGHGGTCYCYVRRVKAGGTICESDHANRVINIGNAVSYPAHWGVSMFWPNFMLIMSMLQVVSLPRETFSSNALSWPPGTALFWTVVTLMLTFGWSRLSFKAGLRIYMGRRRQEEFARLQRWGLTVDLFGNASGTWAIMLSLWGIPSLALTTMYAVPALVDAGIMFDSTGSVPSLLRLLSSVDAISPGLSSWLLYLLVMVWIGIQWGMWDRRGIGGQIARLESLRPVFHNKFTVTEILSMRECLRAAPEIFWEEYANLPDVQVNEATNRKFRERAAPYQARDSGITQRMAFSATIVAIFLAIPTVLFILLEGTLVTWFSDWFIPPQQSSASPSGG